MQFWRKYVTGLFIEQIYFTLGELKRFIGDQKCQKDIQLIINGLFEGLKVYAVYSLLRLRTTMVFQDWKFMWRC